MKNFENDLYYLIPTSQTKAYNYVNISKDKRGKDKSPENIFRQKTITPTKLGQTRQDSNNSIIIYLTTKPKSKCEVKAVEQRKVGNNYFIQGEITLASKVKSLKYCEQKATASAEFSLNSTKSNWSCINARQRYLLNLMSIYLK